MVTDTQAEQMRKEVLVAGARGPYLLRCFRELLDDRQERVEREAKLKEGLRAVYQRLREATGLVAEQGKNLGNNSTELEPYSRR
jgi:hypothetical protein